MMRTNRNSIRTPDEEYLDDVKYRQEMAKILRDDRFGTTEEERTNSLNRAKKWVHGLTIGSGVFAAWAIIYPYPYNIAIAAQVAVFIIAVLSFRIFSGLVKLNSTKPKGSPYPNLLVALLLPAVALSVRAYSFHVLSWTNFWIPASSILLASIIIVVMSYPDILKLLDNALLGIVICMTFSYGLSINMNTIINPVFDHNYTICVLDKHSYSGKHTSYYLNVGPWIDGTSVKVISVDRDYYINKLIGDSVSVVVMSGGFKIPWYYLQ